MKKEVSIDFSFLWMVQAVYFALKTTDLIDWPWWEVFAPTYAALIMTGLILLWVKKK